MSSRLSQRPRTYLRNVRYARPHLETLESRLAPAQAFSFTIDDPNGLFTPYPLLASNFDAIGQLLSHVLDGQGVIDVRVTPDNSFPRASGGTVAVSTIGMHEGLTLVENGTITETRTGTDPNGSEPDVAVTLNTQVYLPGLFLDPSGVDRTGVVPADKTDFITVGLHEIMHALGIQGYREGTGPAYGTFTLGTKANFDALTAFGAGGPQDILYFTGANATAQYGGPVPLTSVGPSVFLSSQNFYHLGNPDGGPGAELAGDLMNGIAFQRGQRYHISDLDLAILADLGWRTIPTGQGEPRVHFAQAGFSAAENAASAVIEVTRSGDTAGPLSVQYAAAAGTASADADFTPAGGTLDFAGGETTRTFIVPLLDDRAQDGSKTVALTLSNPSAGAALGLAAATLTITDFEEGRFDFSTPAVAATESSGRATLTITRVGGTDGTVSVTVVTNGGTATPGLDYTGVTAIVTFGAGDAGPKVVEVPIRADADAEGDETIAVQLQGATGGALLGDVVLGTITIAASTAGSTPITPGTGSTPTPTTPGTVPARFAAARYSSRENRGRIVITVLLTQAPTQPLTIRIATKVLGRGRTFAAAADFRALRGNLVFAPGQRRKTVTLLIRNDRLRESAERLGLVLTNTAGKTLHTAQVVILDDDSLTLRRRRRTFGS